MLFRSNNRKRYRKDPAQKEKPSHSRNGLTACLEGKSLQSKTPLRSRACACRQAFTRPPCLSLQQKACKGFYPFTFLKGSFYFRRRPFQKLFSQPLAPANRQPYKEFRSLRGATKGYAPLDGRPGARAVRAAFRRRRFYYVIRSYHHRRPRPHLPPKDRPKRSEERRVGKEC